MFAHAGFRPLWPVVFFLPWFLLGVAYIFQALLQPRSPMASIGRTIHTHGYRQLRRIGASLMVFGMACLAAAHVARADPAIDMSRPCEASGPREAKLLADVLYENGEFQQAGVCYDAAGDSLRAHRAYLKAAGPRTEVATQGLKEQGDTAKALLNKVQQAFH